MTSPFDIDYVPLLAAPTQQERAARKSAAKLSARNQAKLDASGPATVPTVAQRRAAEDQNRRIRAGRGI
jgi:hypothetical protein